MIDWILGGVKVKKILIFIVVLTATSLVSGVAYSKAKGTISGRVTDPSGNGIGNISIDASNSDDIWMGGSSTDSNGNYRLIVPAGTYKVRFSQLPSGGHYAPEWYNNKRNSQVADLVTVSGFRTTSNINAQLEMGGSISGQVTDASGNGIANVYVGAPDLYGHWMPGSSTDSNGHYSFNMPAGTYKVHFSPSPSTGYHAPAWYVSKGNSEVSDLVTVTAFQTTSNIDAQLEMGGTISGRVTAPLGNGLAYVYVYTVDPDSSVWINGSSTDSKGNYSLNVPAGTYMTHFGSSSSMRYCAPEWYDNRSNFQVADLVTVIALQTTFNINARLEIGGAISGRVTDASGNAIPGVYVQAYDLNDDNIIFNGVTTNSEGLYTIPLAAGNYKVEFSPGPDAGNFAEEWYNNEKDFQSGDEVRVKRSTKSVINIKLEPK